jgi:lipooligosaccharide transport system permease protein
MSTPMMLRVVEREAQVYKKLFRGLAFTTLGQPLLYLAAMGLGLGGLVDAHSGTVDGLNYLDFVAPGLMVASAMQLAATESLWPVLAGVKWMRFYDGIVATPITPRDLYRGYVLWVALRALLAAAAFLIVAALLGAVPSAWGVLAIPACGLTAAAFCAPLTAFAVTQDSELSFPMIMRLGVLPLFLFSGTFFPISQLPTGLQFLAVFSPLWHGVELARNATTSNFEPLADLFHVAVLVVCVAVGARFGTRNYTKRLNA